jgi:hypothetical protein
MIAGARGRRFTKPPDGYATQTKMAEGIPTYDELQLRIRRSADGVYDIEASAPDGRAASGRFRVPLDETQLENFVLRVAQPRRRVRAYRSVQMEHAKRFGSQLFDAVVAGGVRDLYLDARRIADERERGLRITLYLTDVPELMEVPWEFLYDRPRFLSQSIYTPVVRSLDLPNTRSPRKLTPPLRVLGMVSQPQGVEGLDVEREKQKLREALGALEDAEMVELCWLERATLSELHRRIAAPDDVHVLHYIGHGVYDERTAGGLLVLETDAGLPLKVTGEELGSLLQDERSLRLVVLNSCEGARTSHVDPFSGVASSLVEYQIPAVIAMQFEITDEAATTFAGGFYTPLAEGYPVDAALAHARKAMFASGSDIEFGTPVLFLRAKDAQLFDVEGLPQTGRASAKGAASSGTKAIADAAATSAPTVPTHRDRSGFGAEGFPTSWEDKHGDPDARALVIAALERSRGKGSRKQGYRTVVNLAKETGLTVAEVQRIVDSHSSILRSPSPDIRGKPIYKLRT